jgi:VanZ family protein
MDMLQLFDEDEARAKSKTIQANFEDADVRLPMTKAARIAAWSLAIAIVVLSVVPPGLRPETDVPHDLEHFLIFWATGLAFGVGYDCGYSLLAMLLVLFSGAVEITQLFVPGRHARVSDFIVDALAMCCGLLTAWLVGRTSVQV